GDLEVPKHFWTCGQVCEHCKQKRNRVDTYVLAHSDGRFIQVGSTCLQDFTGSDKALKAAQSATMFGDACALAEDSDGESYGGGRGHHTEGLAEFLCDAATAVRAWGWVSAGQARETGGNSTRDLLNRARSIMAKPADRLPARTESDTRHAESALGWAEGLDDATIGTSDYLHNVSIIAKSGVVDRRTMGIACSIIAAYDRVVAKAEEAKRTKASEHFGTVKARSTYVLTL